MSKKILAGSLVTLLALVLATSVRAEESTTKNNLGQTIKKEIQEGKDKLKQATTTAERKEIKAEIKTELKSKLDAARNTKLNNYINNAERELANMLTVLKSSYLKIQDRIADFESKGVNMTDAKAKLAVAKTKLDQAEAKVASFRTDIETGLKAATVKKEIANVKISFKSVKDILKGAHKALVDVIVSIKAQIEPKNTGSTATTTATTTSQ